MQAAFIAFSHVKFAEFYAGLVGGPLVIVVVTVFIGADATGTLTLAQRWERIIERGWAIIAIDVGLSLVNISAFQTMTAQTDATNVIFGFLTVLLVGMLVYAEPFIALEPSAQILTVVPFAILRSMMLAWVNMSRIFALLAVQILVQLLLLFAGQAAQHTAAAMWINVLLPTVFSAPLAALYAVAYLDTLSQERKVAP